METDATTTRGGSIAGLDGVRAVAVIVVFLSHLPIAVTWLDSQGWYSQFSRAGFLGVNMFFVLSGFLITHRLFQTRTDDGRFTWRAFYVGRAARIYPALVAFLVVHAVYAVLWDHPPFGRARDEVIMVVSSLFQFANYAILQNTEHLEENGALWSLSVEGHFYLIWPLVMWALFRRIQLVSASVAVLATLVPLLYLWTAYIFHERGYLSAYLRTDTRIVSVVVGAVAAVLWIKTRSLSPLFVKMLALPAVLLMVVIHSIADGLEPFVWDGGMAVFDLSTAIVLLALATGAFPLVSALEHPLMQWIGRISYGLYIWQIPVLTLLDRHAGSQPQAVLAVAAVAFTVLLGAASHRYVEEPVRQSNLVRRLRQKT